MLHLEEDNRMFIHQDLECRSDWYLELTYEETGFKVSISKTNAKFCSKETALEILKSIGAKTRTTRFKIKERALTIDGKILYYIITKP